MQIDSSGSIAGLIQEAKESAKSQQPQTINGNTQSQATNTGQSDMVTLTDAATRMQRLERAITETPIVNSHRVEQIQQVVNDGNMKMDSAQLATKILTFEGALNSARTGT